jgi:hypothetical protein
MLSLEMEEDVVLRVKGMEIMLEGIVRELKANKGVVDEFIRDDIARFRHCSKDVITHHVQASRNVRKRLEDVTIHSQKRVRKTAQNNLLYGVLCGMSFCMLLQLM